MHPDAAPDAGPYHFEHAVEVRFRDLDAMGHAHHSLPLVYFEEARATFWREMTGRADPADIDYVIAEVSVRYLAPVFYPGRLVAGLRTTRVGGRSFTLEYELRTDEGALMATGRTVQVMYDYGTRTSMPIPPELRRRLESPATEPLNQRREPH